VRRLAAEGVDVSGAIRDPGVPTSVMFKERRVGGYVRVTYYRRGGPGSRLAPGDLDERCIAEASVLHVTGITPALSRSAHETVQAAGAFAVAMPGDCDGPPTRADLELLIRDTVQR
jgi:2-dehydro-3-deoxygluconokinase